MYTRVSPTWIKYNPVIPSGFAIASSLNGLNAIAGDLNGLNVNVNGMGGLNGVNGLGGVGAVNGLNGIAQMNAVNGMNGINGMGNGLGNGMGIMNGNSPIYKCFWPRIARMKMDCSLKKIGQSFQNVIPCSNFLRVWSGTNRDVRIISIEIVFENPGSILNTIKSRKPKRGSSLDNVNNGL